MAPPEPPALPPVPFPPREVMEVSIVREPFASTEIAPPPLPPVKSTTKPPPPLPPNRLEIFHLRSSYLNFDLFVHRSLHNPLHQVQMKRTHLQVLGLFHLLNRLKTLLVQLWVQFLDLHHHQKDQKHSPNDHHQISRYLRMHHPIQ